jgi:hypothetical protein
VRSFKRRLVQVRLHFLLTSSASVLILQRVRKEVASVAEGSGSAKAKFKPVPPPEVEVEDEPLPTSPAFLSDEPEPESEAEPKESRGGGKRVGISLQACLRCSKRIDQPSSHTSRGKTVSTGYLCNIGTGVCHKCSYCAHTKHDCEPVSYSPVLLGFR